MDNETQQDRLERAGVWYELMRTPAWNLLKQYHAIQIQSFANDILLKNDDIKDYERERFELAGVRKLFAMIEEEVEYLKNESNKKDSGPATDDR